MGDTHCGFRTVNVLTACARRAIDVDTQIRRVISSSTSGY
ncbi:hypothetical protein SeGA_4152, partial [Salmonella enterica subsp. enterica serovar Gaminara str. A4-567]